MRNFIIVLFALGLIGCAGCTDADPSTYNYCGIPSSSEAGFSISSSNDGMNIVCNANGEDLDPSDLCTSHNSLCDYWSCLLNYSATLDRIEECAGPLVRFGNDAGINTSDVHGADVGMDTGEVDTGTPDTGSTDTGSTDASDTGEDVTIDASEDVGVDAGMGEVADLCSRLNVEPLPEAEPEAVELWNNLIDDFCEEYISPEWGDEFFDECDALCGLTVNGHYQED